MPIVAGIEEEHTMLVDTIRKHDKKVFAEGRQEGEEAGQKAGLRLAALRLKENGQSREEISRLLGIDISEVP